MRLNTQEKENLTVSLYAISIVSKKIAKRLLKEDTESDFDERLRFD